MTVPVINHERYVQEYQTDDFSGYQKMFDEHGEAVIVDWGIDLNLKTPIRNRKGDVIGVNHQKIEQAIEPGMTGAETEVEAE